MTSTSIFAGDLTPAQAARQITEEIRPLPVECIPLLEALDRVLASDVRSPMDVPMWDNSAPTSRRREERQRRQGRQSSCAW
ncbi:MAG: hypothetical protein HYW06_01975 [Gemmatimonadetes bacterium]|nr:hypothetical protein [Gemmatimonadota bacterium]